MWDRKRQLIWVIGGLIIGTFVAYSDSFTEDDHTFSLRFFIFMETLVVLIMAGLFYFYSRRQNKR
jgi:predicted membrane channel-forming protein YqfA (hemolysin III family)